ncbi:MAG: hypothetical protein Q9165_002468 [Trypethelium subeluteriae]
MGFHWGSNYIDHWPQELQDKVYTTQNDPNAKMTEEQDHFIPIKNGKTGELVVRVPSETVRRVSRTKLRLLLSTDIDVQYGKKFLKLDDHGDKITAHFEDGTTAEGNIIIGCDSVHSKVREAVLPLDKIHLEHVPVTIFNLTQQYTAEQAKFIRSFEHPWLLIGVHPDQPTLAFINIANVKDSDKPESIVFQMLYSKWGGSTPETNEERHRAFKELGQQLCEPFRSAAAWVKEDTWIHPDHLTHWPKPEKWDNHGGRITLAGDAAHPMAPYRGQGLNNALEDASYYIKAITSVVDGKKSLKEAVDAYDAEVLERGTREIDVSYKQAVAFHNFEMMQNSTVARHGTAKVVAAAN